MTATGKPRLLVLASTFPAHAGDGTPAFVLDLAREESTDFETAVLTPAVPGAPRSERIGEVRVRRFRYFPSRWEDLADGAILDNLRADRRRALQVVPLLAAQFFAIRSAVRSFRPDGIHAHWTIPQALVATLAAPRVPMVVTTHGGDIYALRGRVMERVKRWILGRAAHVTTVNQEMARTLHRWGLRPEAVSVASMGVDLREARRAAEGNPKGTSEVVAVGRLVEKKGFDHLIDAVRATAADRDVHLTIVGDGPLGADLRTRAEGLPVTFAGQLGREDVLAHLAGAAVVVLPSVPAANGDQEGLPVVLLEAAAVGAAVIATDIPGINEVIEDGVSGVLVAPRDVDALHGALDRLLDSQALRDEYGAAAQRAAEDYSLERVGERYKGILRRAIEARRG